jgi:nucleoside-diphosphate-sugar epimerase
MKILVAGGAGYVGSMLVPQLQQRGYEVDVIDLLWFGNHLPEGTKIIKKEIMDLSVEDLKKYEQIVFVAGLSNDPMAEYSPSRNFVYNAALPAYLAFTAKQAGVRRMVYACSCSVYGYSVDKLSDETIPAVSSYPYGISKLQGEFACMNLKDDKFSVISLRKGTISGYSPRMRLDLLVNTMFKTAVADHKINVNNPAIWRPVLDIRDAVSAYIRGVEADYSISGIFNISCGNYTVGEVADYVRDGVKEYMGLDVVTNIMHNQDFRNYKVATEKARNILSFNARYGVKDIVRNLVDNYDRFKDFDNQEYYNIKVFKSLDAQKQG